VVIASAVVEGEGMSVPVETPVHVAHRQYALAATTGPAVMTPLVTPMPQQRVVAALMVAVANRTVAANAPAGSC